MTWSSADCMHSGNQSHVLESHLSCSPDCTRKRMWEWCCIDTAVLRMVLLLQHDTSDDTVTQHNCDCKTGCSDNSTADLPFGEQSVAALMPSGCTLQLQLYLTKAHASAHTFDIQTTQDSMWTWSWFCDSTEPCEPKAGSVTTQRCILNVCYIDEHKECNKELFGYNHVAWCWSWIQSCNQLGVTL